MTASVLLVCYLSWLAVNDPTPPPGASTGLVAGKPDKTPDAKLVVPDIPGAMGEAEACRKHWRGGMHCGPNSLFGYLRLHGSNVSREEISQSLPIVEGRGVSLQDMKIVADRMGVPSEVVRCEARDFLSLPKPCIFHCDAAGKGPEEGHFYVLLGQRKEDLDTLLIADFVECDFDSWQYAGFVRAISGYALVPKSHDRLIPKMLLSVALVVAVGLCLKSRCRRKSQTVERFDAC